MKWNAISKTGADAGAVMLARGGLSVLLACAAAAYAAAFGFGFVGMFNDDARYVLAAKSLLAGHYSSDFIPISHPIDNVLPGYPLAMAPFLALGGTGAVKLLSAAATLLGIWAAFLCFGFAAAAVYALHPLVIGLSHTAMTEPLYTAWTVAALYFLKKSDWKLSPALTAFCVFASWIRPEGFLFLLAIAPACAAKLDRKERWLYGISAALFFAAPYARNLAVSGVPICYFREIVHGSTAGETLAKLWPVFRLNSLFYFGASGGAAFVNGWASSPFDIPAAAAALFWVAMAAGMAAAFRSQDRVLASAARYIILMTGFHLLWMNRDMRYLAPLIPFMLPALLAGLPRRAALAAGTAAAALAAFGGIRFALAPAAAVQRTAPARTFAWLKANTAPGDYLMAQSPAAYALNTGRKVYPLLAADDPDIWYAGLLDSGTRYVVCEDSSLIATAQERTGMRDRAFANTVLWTADKSRFRPVFEYAVERVAVFAAAPPAGFAGDLAAMAAARQLSVEGKDSQAVAALRALEKKKAPLKRLDFTLGTALLLNGHAAQSLPYLERAAKTEPDFSRAAANLKAARSAAGAK
ncbi:MAG: hypothetical protein WC421_08680 [Elusimicrobiales bacterium]